MHINAAQAFEALRQDQRQVLIALCAAGVEFIVVGGYAMRCIGRMRKTDDLDSVINQTESNIAQLRVAFEALPSSNTDKLDRMLLPHKKTVWHSVEIFSCMTGLPYADLDSQAMPYMLDGLTLHVMSRSHMTRAKEIALAAPERNASWSTDALDLAFLQCRAEA